MDDLEIGTVKRVSATTQVIETIRTSINSGKLKAGDKLPNEMDLARTIGVGRSSLREGIRTLSSFGLIEIKHGEGTFVADKYAERIFEFLGFDSTPENISYMLELRKVVELGNIRIAADRLTDEQLKELRGMVNAIDPGKYPLEEAERADRMFHESIVRFAGNPLIIEIYKMMSKMLSIVFSNLMCRMEVVQDAYKAHLEILEALEAHDVEASVRTMEAHLDQVNYYAWKYALTR